MYYDPYGLWAWGDPIDQGVLDYATGFGDGTFKVVTLGIGDLGKIRNSIGIDGGVDICSGLYGAGRLGGNIVGGIALGGPITPLGRSGLNL